MALTYRAGLLALVGASVVGLLLPSRLGVLVVTGVVLAMVLLDVVLAGSVRRLRLERSGDTSVRLGQAATVHLLVTNPGRARVRGLARDAWAPSTGATPERFAVDVPPGERRRFTTTLRPTRRGDHRPDRVTIRSIGPLGLAARQGAHAVPWSVRALPPFEARKHLPSRLARLRELDGRAAVLVRGQGTEFDSLRDYVDGDDVRSIDWRATARRTEVVVRTWRPERDRHVVIVLDTGRTSAGRVGDAPRLDHAMDAALLLAALASRAGDRVDLLAYDRRTVASVRRTSQADVLPRSTAALAGVESTLVELDHAGLVSTLLAQAGRRALIVLLTDLSATAIEEGLLPVLGPLLKRHQLLLASVSDPAVEQMASARESAPAVYDAAAAERTRGERHRVTAELRQRGVTVVDEPPASIAPALADSYLALKAAGRL